MKVEGELLIPRAHINARVAGSEGGIIAKGRIRCGQQRGFDLYD